MTTDELTAFLNERTQNMTCPMCHSNDWYVRTENGEVLSTNALDGGLKHDILAAFQQVIDENEIDPTSSISDEPTEFEESNILCSCILLRCNHCGHLEFFDRSFIEEQIHGQK